MNSYYRALERHDPPQRLPAGRGVHRAVRGRARAGRRVRGRRARHHDLHPQRHRGDQPRGLLVGPRATWARATRCSSPRWSTTRTSSRGSCCAPERGARLRYLSVSDEGELDSRELDEVLAGGRVKLVAVAHVSNVLGTINPVAEIAARARAAGAVSLVDGSQAVPQMPVDLPPIGADFYAWTGHKALGPTGIGVLHGRRELLEAMPPVPRRRRHDRPRRGSRCPPWNELPWKFEAGTAADRRGRRPRRRGRLPVGARAWRTCAPTSASSPPTRWSAWPRSRASPSSARPTPTAAAA